MIDYSKFTNADGCKGYYFVDSIEEYGIQFNKIMKRMSFFKEVCNTFNVTMEYLHGIIVKLNIPYRDMFDYTINETNSLFLVENKAVYHLKRKKDYKMNFREFYNVYVSQNQYIGLLYQDIANEIMNDKFSEMFNDEMFLKSVRKYPSNLKIDENMKVNFFESINNSCSTRDLTLKDIAYLISNQNAIDDLKKETKFKFYQHVKDVCYLEMFDIEIHGHIYPISLYIPIKAIITKDWSLIEEQNIYGIIKPNANEKLGEDSNNFFNGKQKYNPYWNSEIVNRLKTYFN